MLSRFLLNIVLVFLVSCNLKQQPSVVQKGVADLSEFSFESKEVRLLDGEWGVVWGKLIADVDKETTKSAVYVDFKSRWKNIPSNETASGTGYASYFIKLIKPDHQDLAIKMPIANTAVKLLIDGKVYFEAGKVGKSASTTKPYYRNAIVELPPTDKEYYQIIMQVSNFHYRSGGFNSYAEIGDKAYILKNDELMADITLILVGAFIFTALYLLALYFLRPQETPMLYIGLFFIILTHRMVSVGEMLLAKLVNLKWEFYIKSDYLTFYLGAVAFILFVQKFFKGQIKLPYNRIIIGILFVASIIVIVFPASIYSYISIPMQFFVLLVTFMLFYQISKLAFRGSFTARLLLIAILALFISVINDVLYYNRIINTGLISHYGMIFLTLSLPFLLPAYFSRLFTQVEVLSQKLTRQNSKLKKLNRDLDAFVYNVSHDLKAPLASIQGLINIIKKEDDIDKIREVTSYQERSVDKLMRFIQDLLNYSRNSRLEVTSEPIDFESILLETIDSIKYIDKYRNIDHELSIKGKAPFRSDKYRIKIVLNNLVSNAFKYHDPEKDYPFVKINVDVHSEFSTITIADNGIGIPEEHQLKVFDMFYRAHDEMTDGTGLGLYLVKECMTNLRGEITLKSREHEGTTVVFKIPNKK